MILFCNYFKPKETDTKWLMTLLNVYVIIKYINIICIKIWSFKFMRLVKNLNTSTCMYSVLSLKKSNAYTTIDLENSQIARFKVAFPELQQ